MRRRRFRKPAVKMSLFPFLAVLICTMGALIVLLVMVVQQARVYAGSVSEDLAREQQAQLDQQDELQLHLEDQSWRRDIFEQQRSELTNRLGDRRLRLSHLEEHIRRLEREGKQLQQQIAELDSISGLRADERASSQAELNRLKARLKESQREFEAAKKEAANRPRAFAIIPYKGPNGTDRRPIYVECTEQGIILQPEGLVLTAEDFAGPLGPGNPLDAGLRTIREYLAGTTTGDGEPYPLLVVRPGGVVAYAVARAAMKSWDEEFGYELVEDEVELAYPRPDPQLRQQLEKTIADARQRQMLLAAAMPSEYREESMTGFVATPTHGGFTRVGSDRSTNRGGYGARRQTGNSHDRGAFAGGSRTMGRPETRSQSTNSQSTPSRSGSNNSTQQASSGNDGGQPTPLASARGRDWGLPNASAHATGITRPIRVVCLTDQFVIQPERGDHRLPRVVAVSDHMVDSIDDFVSAVWQHMEQWGIAVAGGYWKPVLYVQVGPGADARFRELQILLKDSGMDVTRKN